MNFVFACVWAFGGCMLVDKVSDYRSQFSKWWTAEWKTITFPEKVGPCPCTVREPFMPRPGCSQVQAILQGMGLL